MGKKGDSLQVVIQSNFPSAQLNAYKMLVLTEWGVMGGRHDEFGLLLIGCGVLCFCLVGISVCISQCFVQEQLQDILDPQTEDSRGTPRRSSRGYFAKNR